MKQNKQFFRRLLAVAFWLTVWQAAAMAIGQEVFLVSPVQALRTLVQLLPRADFWQRVGFSSGRILLGFVLGAVVSVALGICWKSGVAAEVIGLPNGSIGDALYRAKITLSTGELFAWTFVIILLSAGFEKLFLLALDKAVGAVLGEEGTKC